MTIANDIVTNYVGNSFHHGLHEACSNLYEDLISSEYTILKHESPGVLVFVFDDGSKISFKDKVLFDLLETAERLDAVLVRG